jgi:hypothetical protein
MNSIIKIFTREGPVKNKEGGEILEYKNPQKKNNKIKKKILMSTSREEGKESKKRFTCCEQLPLPFKRQRTK